MDNYYDYAKGDWVTDTSRYREVASRPEFSGVEDLIADAPEEAWAMLLRLLDAVPADTPSHAGYPLEVLVRTHPALIVPLLEREAPRNDLLRKAGLEMWLARGDLDLELEARLQAALGPRFWFLEPASEDVDGDDLPA
jgi:hypothetical protein